MTRSHFFRSFVLALALLVTLFVLPAGAAGGTIGVTIDGSAVPFDSDYGYPFIDQAGRTQVPFRLTMETFGCAVSWEESSRTAIAQKDGTTVRVPIGKSYIVVNGKQVTIDTAALISGGRTYLPIRAVLEAFGAYVSWDSAQRQVVVQTGSSLVRVHFIDVGQGDATLIDCGTTEVLIDGGDNKAGAGLVAYLTPYIDGKLDYIIATHPDADHVGGLDDVLAAFDVGEVIDSGRAATSATYKDYLSAAQSEPGCTFSYDEDRIIPLSSTTALTVIETGDSWSTANDSSVVAQLTSGNVRVLFTGDMSQTVESACLALFEDVDVLKVGHHGSATSTSAAFLKVVKPEYAVVSYKVGNSYHHPTSSALSRLLSQGVTVYGTGKSGTIVLTIQGDTYSFSTSQALTLADAG